MEMYVMKNGKFVKLSKKEMKKELAKGEAARKKEIKKKGHDCFDYADYHEDVFRAGRRVSKHHWTCSKCGELLQVG